VSNFLPFDETVPLELDGRCYEHRLQDVSRKLRGQALQGKSVRNISEAEFNAIVRAGLGRTLAPENARRYLLTEDDVDASTAAFLREPAAEQERQIQQVLLNRKIRDASFRRRVCQAYEDTCAVTGLRIINGGGKAEVQAAHLKPVAEGGPDIVQNGVALSGTIHWLFDRHLISIDTDYRLLVAHNRVPAELQSLFEQQRDQIRLPQDRQLWPHPAFLQDHVDRFAGVA
jgi:putative restriction endonuclease